MSTIKKYDLFYIIIYAKIQNLETIFDEHKLKNNFTQIRKICGCNLNKYKFNCFIFWLDRNQLELIAIWLYILVGWIIIRDNCDKILNYGKWIIEIF